jgi:hypothetical protein
MGGAQILAKHTLIHSLLQTFTQRWVLISDLSADIVAKIWKVIYVILNCGRGYAVFWYTEKFGINRKLRQRVVYK